LSRPSRIRASGRAHRTRPATRRRPTPRSSLPRKENSMGMVRYPLPLTAAMLAKANANEGKPRYDSAPNVAADWHGGDVGQDVDIAEAMQAVANRHSANIETDYDPQHQEGKGKNM